MEMQKTSPLEVRIAETVKGVKKVREFNTKDCREWIRLHMKNIRRPEKKKPAKKGKKGEKDVEKVVRDIQPTDTGIIEES